MAKSDFTALQRRGFLKGLVIAGGASLAGPAVAQAPASTSAPAPGNTPGKLAPPDAALRAAESEPPAALPANACHTER